MPHAFLSPDSVTMVLLLLLGVYLTVRLRLFRISALPFILRNTVGSLFVRDKSAGGAITPFQAVMTALAGTMGVGNIAGVATALVAGGPGAILWMWVSAFFGMATKYAEIALAVRFRVRGADGMLRGGPMYYMSDKKHGLKSKWLAAVFCAACVLCSFGVGNMTQVNSVSQAALQAFSIPAWVTGILTALVLSLVIFGGVRRIARTAEIIIPFISVLYICFAAAFLWISREYVPMALRLIFESAAGPAQAVGGAAGYGVAGAVRYGLSRGVFTNEAGLGSAPIAHASADCESPAHQGAWGVFEVFADTIFVCTVTALVILTAGGGTLWQSGIDGAALTSAAFESVFGPLGRGFIAAAIALFAVPSMLGWCFYGESALSWLTGGDAAAVKCYRAAFVAVSVYGAVAGMGAVWAAADLLNALMALPNIAAIFLLRKHISTRFK
ncbi:MAG: amino acid carrier protein [Oscillospiraceae bacterium]|nr:amino acid carrier protein [Oscillospiraceae bacterium]